MAGIWYCAHCGYEVRKRGKCHNCKAPLTASPLAELGAGESEDEVGYSLDEWEDSVRGELIAQLVDRGLRHRFEGDELVVGAADEGAVDQLIDELSTTDDDVEESAPPSTGELDLAALAVLARLYDAARRLRADPTDMVADGDLAEAAGRMFAIEQPPAVDAEQWAAVGRVTRRLLGALGADEALEEEISESSQLLIRLVEELDLSDTVTKAGGADDGDTGYARLTVPPASPADDPAIVELAPPGPAPDDEMVFELDDWMPEERAQISLLLDRNQIAHEWEGTDLIVAAAADQLVEGLMSEVERATPNDPNLGEEGDDEAQYHVLSNLFGAADRLAGDPENEQKRADLTDAAKGIADWATPFAMTDDDWWKIRLRAKALSDAVELDATGGTIQDHAATLPRRAALLRVTSVTRRFSTGSMYLAKRV